MGWGTFIASRMIRDIKLRDAGLENEKFNRDLARREADNHRLRQEFVRFALEETVLAHPKIRATIDIEEWVELSMKLSYKAINLTASTIYVAISMVFAGISVTPWVSSAGSGDTGAALRIFFYFFFVTGFFYILIEQVYLKRCFGTWINKNFKSKGWNTSELLREVRLMSNPENGNLEQLKGFKKLRLPFLLSIRELKVFKEDLTERSNIRKTRRNKLFPTKPNNE